MSETSSLFCNKSKAIPHRLAAGLKRKVWQLVSGDTTSLLNQARQNELESRSELATRLYERARLCSPYDVAVHVRYAEFLLRAGQLPEAYSLLNEASDLSPNNPAVHQVLASAALRLGERDRAICALTVVAKHDPFNDDQILLLRDLLFSEGAVAVGTKLANELIEQGDPAQKARGFFLRARAKQLVGRAVEAQADIASALSLDASWWPLSEAEGCLLEEVGSSAASRERLAVALGLYGERYGEVSVTSCLKRRAYGLAAYMFEQSPRPEGWLEYLRALRILGRYSVMGQAIIAAREAGVDEAELSLLEAQYLSQSKDKLPAIAAYRKALSLNAIFPKARQGLAGLLRGRGDIREARALLSECETSAKSRLSKILDGELAVFEGGFKPSLAGSPSASFQPVADRVLAVIESSLPQKTSGYTYRSHFVLSQQVSLGFEVAAVTRPGFPEDVGVAEFEQKQQHEGITYFRTTVAGAPRYRKHPLDEYLQQHAVQVGELVAAERPGCIHAVSNFKNGLVAAAVAEKFNLPWVYELRGIWEDTLVSKGVLTEECDLYRYYVEQENWCLQNATAVVTLSETLKSDIVSRGVEADKIFVVPNGVNTEGFPSRYEQDATHDSGEIVIGYISSLNSYEGIDVLIRAFSRLVADRPEVRLVIVGDGEEFESLNQLISDLGLSDKASMVGRVPHEQVLEYYQDIDLFVVPRKPYRVCEIVTPLKPYEAMATGAALVVSDVAALKEIVQEDQTGVTFKAGNEEHLAEVLLSLILDSGKRERLGRNAAEWVRDNRSWQKVCAAYREIFEYAQAAHAEKQGRR